LKIYLPYLSDPTDYQIVLRLQLKFSDLKNYSFHVDDPVYQGQNETGTTSAVEPAHGTLLHVTTPLVTQTN
jgi:hypothetical protein